MEQIPVPSGLLSCFLLIPLRGQEARQKQAGIPHRGRSEIMMNPFRPNFAMTSVSILRTLFVTFFLSCNAPIWAADLSDAGPDPGDSQEMKAAKSLFHVAMASVAAGYKPQWKNAKDVINDLQAGFTLTYEGSPITFKVVPMTVSEQNIALKHIVVSENDPGNLVWKK